MAYQGKKLINDPNDVVTEFIEGMVETYPDLQYLDGFPGIKVVLRADVVSSTYDKVAVICGGGSGHEPAHSGFVGEGMLTAAVIGDVFASPHVDAILAGIRSVTGPMGCLLIVTNYTGDRLNFGLAAEQAKSEGYKIETVVVGDDCALPPARGITGRRGLAGTILITKIAGAAAAAGLSLDEVAEVAKHASEMVGTMGVALSVCTLPGQVTSDRLGPGKMELGLGIHGEPGAAVADLQPVDLVVSHVLKQILSRETNYLTLPRGSHIVLLINGSNCRLGGTPTMELMIASGKAVLQLQLEHGLIVDRVYTGSFMTSLDMAGGSRNSTAFGCPYQSSILAAVDSTRELNEQGYILEAAIEAGAKEIINLKDALNEWDSKVGDGDCGSTMFRGAMAILEDMKESYPLNDAAETIKEIGDSVGRVMGGTSGILYSILCKAAYAKLKESPVITPLQWANALEASIEAISKYGGAIAGYRTMLDALIPASKTLKESLDAGKDSLTAFLLSSEAAVNGAEATKNMSAQAGRSSYVSADILMTVPDPGAMAVAGWYRAATLAVKSKLQP
ncbi:putative 3,4-dihydroxy-2-butanone kinase [Acorus calamus]|uniref:3,4-dihydroxy-2-butanone kinase n=1 Tax=Acorus calamus TaxID=4465 RepID=A0AAV9ELU5_ACOCL|nr:putative 3,4-dihydroxy-2-butanone kinase [Acorus calamus]